MFDRRLTELTAEDIQQVVANRMQEDATLELKGASAVRDGGQDPWYEGGGRLGNEAKKSLAKELIAFANAEGGTLILGIHEDGEKRADPIAPLPGCRELADRLAASIATTTDPKFASLETRAWRQAAKVAASWFSGFRNRIAHHIGTATPRSATSALEIVPSQWMRQIQDLSIQRARGIAEVGKGIDARSTAFELIVPDGEYQGRGGRAMVLRGCGVRASAIPLEEIFVERIRDNRRFQFPLPLLVETRRTVAKNS